MAVGTATISGVSLNATYLPYNTGTALTNSSGTVAAVLNDTSSNTYVQPQGGLAGLVLDTTNPTTGGSVVTRVRAVARIKSGDGNLIQMILGPATSGQPQSSVQFVPTAAADTLYAGPWTSSGTAYAAWGTAALNAAQISFLTGSTSQRITRVYLEFDLTSSPAGTPSIAAVNTDRPTVNWTFSDADGGTQAFASVKVFSSAQYSAGGFDAGTSTALWSTVITGTALTATPDSAIVTNGLVYRPYVQATKIVNGVFVPSAWTTSTAASTASFTAPTAPTVTPTWDSTNRRVSVNVAGSAGQRFTLTRSGTVLGTALDTIPASGTATVLDYLALRGTAQVYAATITTAATASPQLTSGTGLGTVTTGTATTWEVRALAAPTTVVDYASPVTGIDFTRAEANAVLRPLGSTKAVVVAGDMTGDDGSLAWTTRTRSGWETLKAILTYQGPLLLSPFRRADGTNEQWVVRLTSRAWESDGTTTDPIQRATADFVEVDPVDSSTY